MRPARHDGWGPYRAYHCRSATRSRALRVLRILIPPLQPTPVMPYRIEGKDHAPCPAGDREHGRFTCRAARIQDACRDIGDGVPAKCDGPVDFLNTVGTVDLLVTE